MLGHAAIAETALADVGGVLQVATAEMSGISSASSVGVGELVGVATLDANFTKTTAGILITGSANADLSFDFTQTTENIKVVNFTDATLSTEFTQTSDGYYSIRCCNKRFEFYKNNIWRYTVCSSNNRCNNRNIYRSDTKWH
jgi:hypothetical protein